LSRKIKIVTDSTSDIPAPLARELDVAVVPLNVRFGSQSYKDRVDLDSAEFFRQLGSSGELPTTSLPSPGDFAAAYERLIGKYESIISIHISGRLSGTCQSARTALLELKGKDITVLDSGTVSSALLLIVVRAARAAKAGLGRDEILRQIEEDRGNVSIHFVVDTLNYLKRGGRIGRAGHLIGSLLNVKPILTVNEGIIDSAAMVRSRPKAFRRVAEILKEKYPSPRLSAISHANALEESREVWNIIREFFPDVEIITSEIGPVIGTHTGPGCIEISML
jgi:DegV family protein with EDD domain